MPINTTAGPVEYDRSRPGHVVNTSRVVDEDMEILDEAEEIISVLPATGWAAAVGERFVPLVVFVAMDSGKLYGVAVGADGLVDLEDNIEVAGDFNGYHPHPGFSGYKQANNDKEEQ